MPSITPQLLITVLIFPIIGASVAWFIKNYPAIPERFGFWSIIVIPAFFIFFLFLYANLIDHTWKSQGGAIEAVCYLVGFFYMLRPIYD